MHFPSQKEKSYLASIGCSFSLDLWISTRLLRGSERSREIRTELLQGNPRLEPPVLNRSWRVNQCRDQFGMYKLFYLNGKCKVLFLKSWLIDPHIECCLGMPKALSRLYWYKFYNKVMLNCKLTKSQCSEGLLLEMNNWGSEKGYINLKF